MATVGAVLLTVTSVYVALLIRRLLLLLAERPTSTLDAIAIVTLPTGVHVVPFADTEPARTLPDLTSLTQ